MMKLKQKVIKYRRSRECHNHKTNLSTDKTWHVYAKHMLFQAEVFKEKSSKNAAQRAAC